MHYILSASFRGTFSVLFLLIALTSIAKEQEAIPTITASGPTTFCESGSVTFTASMGDSYLWSTGATTQSITVTQAGTYFVTVTVNGVANTSENKVVTIKQRPVLNSNLTTTFCSNDNNVYMFASSGVDFVFGSGATSGSGKGFFRPSLASVGANGTGSVVAFSAPGCSSTFVYTIKKAATIVLNQSTYTACAPATVNLQNALASTSFLPSGTTIQYLLNNIAVADPSAVDQTGVYTVRATTLEGCVTEASVNVTIRQPPVLNSSLTTTFCSNDNNNYVFALSGVDFVFGAGASKTGSGASFRPSLASSGANGIGSVVAFSGPGCSSTFVYTINKAAELTLTQSSYRACAPATVNLQTVLAPTSILPAGTTFEYLLNNVPVTTPSAINETGTYTIRATTLEGCQTQIQVPVTINQPPVINSNLTTTFCSNDNNVYMFASSGVDFVFGSGATSGSGKGFFRPSLASVGANGSGSVAAFSAPGCSSTFVYTIGQPANLNLSQPSYGICSNSSLNLETVLAPTSVLPQGTTLSYYFNGNPVLNPTAVNQAGTYVIRANNNGCITEKQVSLTVNPAPVLSSSLPTTFCSNDNEAYFVISGPVNNAVGQGISTSPSGSVYFRPSLVPNSGPGSFIIGINGCFTTFNYTINRAALLNLSQPSYAACAPATVSLLNALSPTSILPPGTTIEYLLNGITVSNPGAISQTGIYTIRATTPEGCVTEKAVNVTINQPPALSSTLPSTFCSNDNAAYFVIAGPVDNAIGQGLTVSPSGSVSFRPSLVPNSGPGSFIIGINGCFTTFNYTINRAALLNLSQSSYSVCSPATVNLETVLAPTSMLPSGTTVEYLLNGVSVTDPTTISQTGLYTIRATTAEGCISERTVSVTIKQPPVLSTTLPTTFCSNDNASYFVIGGPVNNAIGQGLITSPSGSVSFRPSLVPNTGAGSFGIGINGCFTTFNYTIQPPPAITNCPSNITVSSTENSCGAIVNYTPPSATTTCGASFERTAGPATGSVFTLGTTTVTYTLTLTNGSTQTCSFTITVVDDIDPVINCAASQNLSTLPGQCGANYSGVATATDNCGTVTVTGTRSDALPLSALYPVGLTTITWKAVDAAGNMVTCAQQITVTDNEAPVVTCPVLPQQCLNASGNYAIPLLVATDNCSIQTISFVITGATSRSGSGTNASGLFNPGSSTITWTVTDGSGNSTSCQTMVGVAQALTLVIPDVSVLPAGVDPNTVYPGYAPASGITLTANISGGTPPYSFVWSNGATGSSITVSPTAPTTYTVTITDALGCIISRSKTVQVINVSCGNKGDKVLVCQTQSTGNPHTICISKSAVATHLANGSYLGPCVTTESVTSARGGVEVREVPLRLELKAFPNPSPNSFTLQIVLAKEERAELVIYDALGKVIERRVVVSGNLSVGRGLRPGIYFAELRQGGERRTVKLIRQ